MFQQLFANTEQLIQSEPWLAFIAVLLGGTMTASNPCVIAMIPLTISFVGGYKETKGVKQSFFLSLTFVLGLTVMFTAMGLIAALLGTLFGVTGKFWPYIVSGVCFIMGLHLLDILQFNIPFPQNLRPKQTGYLGAFFLGLLFGIVSAPCAAPILIVLLTYIAAKGNIVYGTMLLWTYAFGHCLLILIAGTSIGFAKTLLESKGYATANLILRKLAGLVIIGVGIYFLL
ncbi:MAG: cytochrome c biogenesis protein CcdA [bacterium]|nr:cytochrome c biogenesis protein CcdA [bacterium]